MVNPCSVLAHLMKSVSSYQCLKFIFVTKRTRNHRWAVRAFQILFFHSILGILQYGTPVSRSSRILSKLFRSFYHWCSGFIDCLFLAFLVMDILYAYENTDNLLTLIATIAILPLLLKMALASTDGEIRKDKYLLNITVPLLLLVILVTGLSNGNCLVISFVLSYCVHCYIIDEICSRYEVPYIDLKEYSLCFAEFFTILIIKEI